MATLVAEPPDLDYRDLYAGFGAARSVIHTIELLSGGRDEQESAIPITLASGLTTYVSFLELLEQFRASPDIRETSKTPQLYIQADRKIHFYYEMQMPCTMDGHLLHANQWTLPPNVTVLDHIKTTFTHRLADFLRYNNHYVKMLQPDHTWLQIFERQGIHGFSCILKPTQGYLCLLRFHFHGLVFDNCLELHEFVREFQIYLLRVDFRFLFEGYAPLTSGCTMPTDEQAEFMSSSSIYQSGGLLRMHGDIHGSEKTTDGPFSDIIALGRMGLCFFLPHNYLTYDGLNGGLLKYGTRSRMFGKGADSALYQRMSITRLFLTHALDSQAFEEEKVVLVACLERRLQLKDQLTKIRMIKDEGHTFENKKLRTFAKLNPKAPVSTTILDSEIAHLTLYITITIDHINKIPTLGSLNRLVDTITLFDETTLVFSQFYSVIPNDLLAVTKRYTAAVTPVGRIKFQQELKLQSFKPKAKILILAQAPRNERRLQWLLMPSPCVMMLTSEWLSLLQPRLPDNAPIEEFHPEIVHSMTPIPKVAITTLIPITSAPDLPPPYVSNSLIRASDRLTSHKTRTLGLRTVIKPFLPVKAPVIINSPVVVTAIPLLEPSTPPSHQPSQMTRAQQIAEATHRAAIEMAVRNNTTIPARPARATRRIENSTESEKKRVNEEHKSIVEQKPFVAPSVDILSGIQKINDDLTNLHPPRVPQIIENHRLSRIQNSKSIENQPSSLSQLVTNQMGSDTMTEVLPSQRRSGIIPSSRDKLALFAEEEKKYPHDDLYTRNSLLQNIPTAPPTSVSPSAPIPPSAPLVNPVAVRKVAILSSTRSTIEPKNFLSEIQTYKLKSTPKVEVKPDTTPPPLLIPSTSLMTNNTEPKNFLQEVLTFKLKPTKKDAEASVSASFLYLRTARNSRRGKHTH